MSDAREQHRVDLKCTCRSSAVPSADREADLNLLKIASDHFRGDIAAHWTQASFFAIIQGGLTAFFSAIVGPHSQEDLPGLLGPRAEAAVLAAVGLFFAVLWCVMAMGRERYIKRWRDAVTHLDSAVDRHHIYELIEREAGSDRFNPTRLVAWAPFVLAVGWTVALLVLLFT